MRPPRDRRHRRDITTIIGLDALIWLSSGFATLLLLRIALITSDAEALEISAFDLVLWLTDPVFEGIWKIPGATFEVFGRITAAEIAVLIGFLVMPVLAAGIMSGWRSEGGERVIHSVHDRTESPSEQ